MDLAGIAQLENVMLATWPPLDVAENAGWVVQSNGGYTGRANTLVATADGCVPTNDGDVDALITWAESWYGHRQQSPAARITPLSAEILGPLTDRGWLPWKNGATVMVGDLPVLDVELPARCTTTASADLADSWLRCAGHDADVGVTLRQMFSGADAPVRHVGVVVDDETVAVGRGGLHDGHLMVSGMATSEQFRRRGLARVVLADLANWAIELGATRMTLQVEIGNTGARALYESLGLRALYDYSYVARL